MSKNKSPRLSPGQNPGFFGGLANQFKLVMRLMGDRRVSPFLKLIPAVSVLYFFFPDLAPGPIDDALIIWLTTYLFVELCPPDVVEEHRKQIEGTLAGSWRDAPDKQENKIDEGDIIDGEFHDE